MIARLADRMAGTWSSAQRITAGVFLGLTTAAGQSPWSLPVISLLALFLILSVYIKIEDTKRAAWFGWFVGFGFFATTMFWIVEPFLVEPERHGWMAPFALVFMAGGLALFWALGFGLAARISQGRTRRLVALLVCFGLAEMTRSYALTGFPWGLLGYIWVETPLIQLTAFIGLHGLGFLTLGIVSLPVMFSKRWVGFGLSGLVLASAWGIGWSRLALEDIPRLETVNLRLIQPNASQREKWDPRFIPMFFQSQLELSASVSGVSPDLVIWPEASIAPWLDSEPETQKQIAQAVGPNARAILGLRRIEGSRYYNSLAVLDDQGVATDIYDKTHLVPFGEYIPFGDLFSKFGIYGLASSEGGGFTSGKKAQLIDLGRAGKVLPLICYEAIFPQMSRFTSDRPDWILQLTNDAWYGDLAGPQQHLAQARVRAVEQGLPLVRVANTGVSAVIDSRGRIIDHLPLGRMGFLDAEVPGVLPQTFYSKTGDLGVLLFLLAGLSALAVAGRRK